MNIKYFKCWKLLFLVMELNINKNCYVAAKRDYLVVGNKIACDHSIPEYVESYNCHIDIRNNRTFGSGHLYLKKAVEKLDIQALLHGKRPNRRQLTLVDLRFNGCELLSVSQKVKAIETIRKIFFRYVNEISKCPLKANFNYTVADMFIDEEDLPSYIPESNFHVGVYVHKKEKRVLQFNFEGKIIHTNKVKMGASSKKRGTPKK